MYLPRAFAEADLAALDRLVARDPFVTLVTVAAGQPCIAHVPVLYARSGDRIVLEGHWARVNAQALHGGAATAVVHGPHAYVSPSVYPDKEAAARVPTWNYAVAHLGGHLHTTEDTDALADLVGRMSAHFEALTGHDWVFEGGCPALRRQLAGIVGFRFEVDEVQMKFKLSQNHPEANVLAVEADLRQRRQPAATEVAELMAAWRTRAPTHPSP